ncbi:MAG: hypothetical protein RLZZ200_2506 [Pseudomonadota bacterium]|jgi:hypothetical protein
MIRFRARPALQATTAVVSVAVGSLSMLILGCASVGSSLPGVVTVAQAH